MDRNRIDSYATWQSRSSETLHDSTEPSYRVPDIEKDQERVHEPAHEVPPVEEKTIDNHVDADDERAASQQIITLPSSDPEHPNNWSKPKKALIVIGGIVAVIHSTLGSSLPSNAIEYIAQDFGVTSQLQLVLPISCFLMGYVFAPTICGPLSEHFGRKPVMMSSFLSFTIFTMCCAVAPTWGSLLFFRFACGITGSAPIACTAGIYADINSNPRARGRTMAMFMAATVTGPIFAPPISGFIAQNTTWRWVFGVAAIFAGCTLPFIVLLPETYAPIILSKRAARLRKETRNPNIIAQSDLQKKSFRYLVAVVMARPYRMLFRELIVSTTCAYLALCYGIFYLYFEAYPIIFQGPNSIYKYSPGIAGLTFLPIGIGAILALGLFFMWDIYLARAQERKAPWSQKEEFRRLPVALLGGPLFAVSIFWLGWSSRENVFWLAPVASGVPFGAGFMLIFMAMLNYLSDAYMTFSASAQGIASTARSVLGVLLPFASHQMFKSLGVSWACSTLGFLSLLMGVLPFLFMKYGERLRANSKFCQEIHALHQKELEEAERKREQQDGRPQSI